MGCWSRRGSRTHKGGHAWRRFCPVPRRDWYTGVDGDEGLECGLVSLRGAASPEGAAGRLGRGVRDQAELPSPGGGLGPVGGAELAQDVRHVRFDGVERHDQVVGDALIRLARREQPQHLQFAAGQRLGQARRCGGTASASPDVRRSAAR